MSPLEKVTVGIAAEKIVTVTPEMTVGHVVPGMPAVYGTPMMIQHMEMAAGSAIQSFLPAGYVGINPVAIMKSCRSRNDPRVTLPLIISPVRGSVTLEP